MLIRSRGEILGTIEAPDEQAAEQIAAERYGLTKPQLARLALREMRVVSRNTAGSPTKST